MTYLIHTVSGREKLKIRSEPYWVQLSSGCHLGYRVNVKMGTWIARYTHKGEVKTKREFKSLGSLDEFSPKDQFSEAKVRAESWFGHLKNGGISKSGLLKDACKAYIANVKKTKGSRAATDVERRFNQYVLDDPRFANTELQNLSKYLLKQWREKLQSTPISAGPRKGKLRSSETLNRDMTCLRACLNYVFDQGLVTSDLAWRNALRPVSKSQSSEVGRQREVYLSKAQRQALIDDVNLAHPELVPFLKGLCLIPLRPGALAKLTVADFNAARHILKVSDDKVNAGRLIPLPVETALFFKSQCVNKLPGAFIFSRNNGVAWNKDSWKKPIKLSAQRLGLPSETVAYTFRHSVITDLVEANIPIMTIALLSGTSVRMIEHNYAKLTSEMSASALAVLSR